MRIALRAGVRLQARSHHRVLPQLVGRRAQSQHALPFRAATLTYTHEAQVIVEDRPGVPLEHLPTAVPIVMLALTAILVAAIAVDGGTSASSSYHAPLQVVIRHMLVDLLQTLSPFEFLQIHMAARDSLG